MRQKGAFSRPFPHFLESMETVAISRFHPLFKRKEGDSNPRIGFADYTLSSPTPPLCNALMFSVLTKSAAALLQTRLGFRARKCNNSVRKPQEKYKRSCRSSFAVRIKVLLLQCPKQQANETENIREGQEYDLIESGRNYRKSRPNGDPELRFYIEMLFAEWLEGEAD